MQFSRNRNLSSHNVGEVSVPFQEYQEHIQSGQRPLQERRDYFIRAVCKKTLRYCSGCRYSTNKNYVQIEFVSKKCNISCCMLPRRWFEELADSSVFPPGEETRQLHRILYIIMNIKTNRVRRNIWAKQNQWYHLFLTLQPWQVTVCSSDDGGVLHGRRK